MNDAKSLDMGSIRKYIEGLEQEFGGLRAAGRALDIDYQKLQYWKKSGEKLQQFLDFLEESRRKTRKSKTAVWDAVITKGRKKLE